MKATVILCAIALAGSVAVLLNVKFWLGPKKPHTVLTLDEPQRATNQPQSTESYPLQWVTNGVYVVTNIPPTPAERVVEALVESGMTQEEATTAYKRISEMARIERSTRRPMPSVRTNVDVKRFPLFEE